VNSTLKSLLFWMVLVVVGVLIWNFSNTFRPTEQAIPFSEFVSRVDSGQVTEVTRPTTTTSWSASCSTTA
jgi:hypothetical protein